MAWGGARHLRRVGDMPGRPDYILIAERIQAECVAEALASDGRIPSQHALAERYGVSRPTIVRAISRLAAEGVVRTVQGGGVYVEREAPRSSPTRLLGFVTFARGAAVVLRLYDGIQRQARRMGSHVVMASYEGGIDAEEEAVAAQLEAGVDGVILYPRTRHRMEAATDYLRTRFRDAAIVTVGGWREEWRRSGVQFDNRALGREMTEELLRHGRRRIAYAHASPDMLHAALHERREGWLDALREAGKPPMGDCLTWPQPAVDYGGRDRGDDVYDRMADAFLRLRPRPDAAILYSDEPAVLFTSALHRRGVRVPDDVLVAGFDDVDRGRLFRPPHPTSVPAFDSMGELAVELLDRIARGGPSTPVRYLLPVPVVWRAPSTSEGPDGAKSEGGGP